LALNFLGSSPLTWHFASAWTHWIGSFW
jgi:hypothetical protein